MKVLVADDDPSVRESLGKVLRGEGYEVVLAGDGQSALECFENDSIDLLLLDLGLPIRTGWDTFEHITNENPLVPIIIITGQSDQYDVAVAAGVGALMEKPLDVSRLLQTMHELLAEPKQARLRRLCGYSHDLRYVPRDSAAFLNALREQQQARFKHLRADGRHDWRPTQGEPFA